jgi:SAM-dependent methyltransferase
MLKMGSAVLVGTVCAMAVAGVGSAQYQRFYTPGGSITYGPDRETYQQFTTPGGSITYGPDGRTYQQFDTPGGSITYGPDGRTYQQFHTPGGSIMYGPGGRTWQQFDTPSGSIIYGPDRYSRHRPFGHRPAPSTAGNPLLHPIGDVPLEIPAGLRAASRGRLAWLRATEQQRADTRWSSESRNIGRRLERLITKSDWDYRGLAAECYDLWFGDEPFWDQAFFGDRIRHNGDGALEIGCGTGRLLVPFLRDGLAVAGMDASEEMLAICRAKAARIGVTPTLHRQHMQDMDLAARYRTLFIPACSFQILAERDEALGAMRGFHRHLEPGGELLITLMVPWRDFGVERQWRLRRSGVRPADGATILIHEATVSDRLEQVQESGCATRSTGRVAWCRLNCARIGCGGITGTSLP